MVAYRSCVPFLIASDLAILYTVVRETCLVDKEILPGSEDAKWGKSQRAEIRGQFPG
jgi:hypothetical protein